MKSFSIIRTNVGLTTNVKVICDSSYNLFLESIDSDPDLSITKLKKMQFNKNNFYDELVPYFFKDFPSDIAFRVFNTDDSDNMSSDFSNQYEDLYIMGARNIVNNKNYPEEYEYFAPLYIFKESFPKYFLIFRIDGPGLEELTTGNFRSNFLKKFKTVKLFDLTRKSILGEWIDRNFISNKSYPVTSLEVDFRNLEFTRWYGIDYNTGGYSYKSQFIDDSIESENTLFDFEKNFFDGYKKNKIIFPQIVNFSFLFDDTPATPTNLRKWSINRYSGFYIEDMELIDCISPFVMPKLKSDVTILDGNIIHSSSGDPFVLGYDETKDMWVEYDGEFYKVEKIKETSVLKKLSTSVSKNPPKRLLNEKITKTEISRKFTQETVKKEEYKTITNIKYRIISEIDLSGKQSELNRKTCLIDEQNRIINFYTGEAHTIQNFESSDINLIEIDGIYHNVILEDGYLKLHTDYGFNYKTEYRLEYFIASPDPNFYKFVDLYITKDNLPKCLKLYRLKFSDVKDFDTQIIDNEFSKFEYESRNSITETEESKMYTTDLRSMSNPPTLNDYIFNNEVVFMPCSSDYTANLETFRIVDNKLSEIWNKNPVFCRFGFQKSLSSNDYPYLLNNNDVHENYNRTTDTNNYLPLRSSRNLDYFYTLNSGTYSYIHHTLHIEKNLNGTQDPNFVFEFDKYLNISTYSLTATISATYSFDYFSSFFGATQTFFENKIIKNSKKYSYFDFGDSSIPNTTLFRGLKFKIFEVESIIKNEISIENINAFSSNLFNNYKFSILLSENFYNIDGNGELYKPFHWEKFEKIFATAGNLGVILSDTGTSSILQAGDVVNIYQYLPKLDESIDGRTSVTYVGYVGDGNYGFVTNLSLTQSLSQSYTQSGYFSLNFQWTQIKEWELNNQYYTGDKVLFEDVVYNVLYDNFIDDPNIDPTNSTFYTTSNLNYPFWNPLHSYSQYDWCYRQGDFYVRNNTDESQGINFWHSTVNYNTNNVVKWKGKYYKLTKETISLKERPEENNSKNSISSLNKKWTEIPDPKKWYAYEENFADFSDELWDLVPIWDDNEYYLENDFVVYNETLYKYTADSSELNIKPSDNENCTRVFSFEPDTDITYTPTYNPVIKIGETYYLCIYNRLNTLESGINIIINKKHKNVLVNIYINDGTMRNIKNSVRDDIYVDSNSRITAANFIRQFNDLDSKFDFADYTSYIIIEEDGSIMKYDFDHNIENLPYFIVCEEADNFELKNDTLKYKVNTPNRTQVKPLRFLVNGEIDSMEKINYYNEIPLGCEIDKKDEEKDFGINYNSRRNITVSKNATVKPKSNANISETFFRHSGYYMPIFYDIELFRSQGEFDTIFGNYKFDESLTEFGIVKQRVLSKINRKGSILKLRDSENLKSIYPMLDEFGYFVSDFFIFKSTWDYKYHIECRQPNTTVITTSLKDKIISLDKFIEKNSFQK